MTNHTKENLGLDAPLIAEMLGEIECSGKAMIIICESDTA